MAQFDIDLQEIEHITKVVDLNSKKILEIGCGNGRLTEQLAQFSVSVMAIDPDTDIITLNNSNNTLSNVTYQVGNATDLPFDLDSFDVIIFSLSLCCVEPEEKMRDAVMEAIRVLHSDGYLINLMPSTVRNFDAGYMWHYIDEDSLNQVFDMSVTAARMVLKQIVFNERAIKFVEERRIPTRWGYDNIDEAKERWISRYNASSEGKSSEHRVTFERELDRFLQNMKLIWGIDEEMQVLQKQD